MWNAELVASASISQAKASSAHTGHAPSPEPHCGRVRGRKADGPSRCSSSEQHPQFGDYDPLFGAASKDYGGRGRYGESARPVFSLGRYMDCFCGDLNDMPHLLDLLLCYKITLVSPSCSAIPIFFFCVCALFYEFYMLL